MVEGSHIAKSKSCPQECTSCTSNANSLLKGLDIGQKAKLDEQRTELFFNKGESIYREGIHPTGLYCLSRGKVMITKSDVHGNSIIVNLHREVTFLGMSEYIMQSPYVTRCIALSDTKVCLIKHENFQNFMDDNPTFTKRILNEMALQTTQSRNRLLAIAKKHMRARMADALSELHQVFGTDQNGFLDVYLKRSDLAILSNMSEANAIRQLSAFDKEKLIKLSGKRIVLLDEKQLMHESNVA